MGAREVSTAGGLSTRQSSGLARRSTKRDRVRMHRTLTEILHSRGGVISRRDNAELGSQIDYATRAGDLVRVLPTVYVHREPSNSWRTRVRAVSLWNENAVVVGEAAAALTFWRPRTPHTISVAGPQARSRHPGLAFTRRVVPPELTTTRQGIRISSPNLTAIDLAPASRGHSIDDALRTRTATIAGMYSAPDLTTWRRGNTARRRLLLDSRSEPWSSRERLAHRLLRGAGITRWRGNVPIICSGNLFFQDIAMDVRPLVIEIDGRQHMDPATADNDRWRGNLLLLVDKQVLRFTAERLDDPEDFIDVTRRALVVCGAQAATRGIRSRIAR